jgi:hypothetical protein
MIEPRYVIHFEDKDGRLSTSETTQKNLIKELIAIEQDECYILSVHVL